ncbi:MAG: DnaJ domain-containing protein [Spirochaetes bacterium]|nr:DnaJ domain-containing protein [Spirochaetota bacterium]
MLKKYLPVILAAIYILSPFDIIPDWILGAGWLDDAAVLGFLLWKIFRIKKGSESYRQYRQNTNTGTSTGQNSSESSSSEEKQKSNAKKEETDPYTVLGVKCDASKKEIKAAYAELAAKYHPDKVQHLGKEFQELAHEKFTAINNAYQMLVK